MALLACLAVAVPAGPGPGRIPPAHGQQDALDGGDLSTAGEARLLEMIEAADARRDELEAQAADVDSEVADLRSQLNASEEHLHALLARQWTLEHRLEASRQQLEAARARRLDLAIDAYTGRASAVGYASTLLYADDLGSLAARRSYEQFLGASQADTVAEEERLRDEVTDLLEEIDGVRRQMSAKRDARTGQLERVETNRRVRVGLLEEAEAELEARDALYEEARSRQAEFDAELADLAARSEEVTRILQERRGLAEQAGSELSEAEAAASGGQLAHPLPGHRLGSPFGPRVHPIFGSVRMHTGVDIGAARGEPIHAAEGGEVVTAGWLGGYGNTAVIDHGGGLATLYGHQSSVQVAPGERVERGQTIGRVGCTGTCTGDHLHFEVRVNGRPVNPAPYIT